MGEYSLRRSPLVEILGIELKNPPFYGDGYIVPHVKVYSFKYVFFFFFLFLLFHFIVDFIVDSCFPFSA